ncbi:MAG: aldehyde dehydrogenase [Candidatus Faecousia sp.]|nr:aldehyde dehydrogenase [Candidatus Faecousia sp.]
MTQQEIAALAQRQRDYFSTGITQDVGFRLEQLQKLRDAVQANEAAIQKALREDLGKSGYEGFMCETGLVLSEISYLLRHTGRFARRKTVYSPLAQFPSHSFRQPTPYGCTLILSPWNYPFLLTLEPLADAIAAGNTVILKPSAYSPATSQLLKELMDHTFPREYVAVVTGGREENSALLDEKFDLVFFTGSQAVGKEVLRRCAEHLTPAVLELGGKSPCIVEESADIKLAARRIVFGKFLNCGQTCVAPDYLLCHSSIKERLMEEIQKQIRIQFGETPLMNPDYGKIINRKHFSRLLGLLNCGRIVTGGDIDDDGCRIAPTVLDGIGWEDPVMEQEIFGPLLPVLPYDRLDEVLERLDRSPKPLALYLFSKNREHIRRVMGQARFGGGCVNDVVIHLATSGMGFGGVGESGMGAYHGKAGFNAFSHEKSIVDKKCWLDLPMRYQPYGNALYERLLRFFLR